MENIHDTIIYAILVQKLNLVNMSQYVRAGKVIARIGMTGYTYLPHFHFQVFVITGINMWTDFETIEVHDFC